MPPFPPSPTFAGGRLGVPAGRFSVGSCASSLGILNSSQIQQLDTSCSGSSYEGVGQQLSPV